MKYMLLINRPTEDPGLSEAEQAAEMQEWFGYTAALGESGVLVAGEALATSAPGATVDRVTGAVQVTDGPFAETKEVVGGFYLLETPTRDDAVAWAAKMPGHGTVDVVECVNFEQ